MALKRTSISSIDLDSYDVLPLGQKGEIFAAVKAFCDSDAEVSDVFTDVTPAQVAAFRKAIADLDMTEDISIDTLSKVTGSKTYKVTKTKNDGKTVSWDVTKDVRERMGIFLKRS